MGVLAVAALLACVRVGERPHVAGIPITAEGRSKLGGSSTHSLTTLAFSLSLHDLYISSSLRTAFWCDIAATEGGQWTKRF